ncbi:MAG: hypothetical protein ACOY94_05900 [Bacillota bacterium]
MFYSPGDLNRCRAPRASSRAGSPVEGQLRSQQPQYLSDLLLLQFAPGIALCGFDQVSGESGPKGSSPPDLLRQRGQTASDPLSQPGVAGSGQAFGQELIVHPPALTLQPDSLRLQFCKLDLLTLAGFPPPVLKTVAVRPDPQRGPHLRQQRRLHRICPDIPTVAPVQKGTPRTYIVALGPTP